jgi:hypothetical protein
MEGKGYKLWGYSFTKPKFGFNGGRGQVILPFNGYNDVYFKKYDEWITGEKGRLIVNNLLFGTLQVDFESNDKLINHRTKEWMDVKIIPKQSETENSKIYCKAFSADGVLKAEIHGSWLDQITYRDVETGEEELIWKQPSLIENAHMQYFYSKFSLLMNYVDDDLKEHLPRTDSRFRHDVRQFEEGNFERSEAEKNRIEER